MSEYDHAIDALRYGLMFTPDPPRPWLVRKWRGFRFWLSWRLRDLADWVSPW
jgi:hypothetical protein